MAFDTKWSTYRAKVKPLIRQRGRFGGSVGSTRVGVESRESRLVLRAMLPRNGSAKWDFAMSTTNSMIKSGDESSTGLCTRSIHILHVFCFLCVFHGVIICLVYMFIP